MIVSAWASPVAYAGMAILQTWPLVRHLDTHLPGLGLGDNVAFVWNLWWMREALASSSATFFNSPMLFAPIGMPLVLHTHTVALAWIGATLLSSISVVAAQNLLLIASIALNGWSVWLLTRALTRDDLAAFVAGAVFLMSPVIAGRLMGHFNLVAIWPLVLACFAYVTWWRRRDRISGVALGVAAGLLPFFDYYLSIYFLVFALVHSAATGMTIEIAREPRSGRRLGRVTAAIAVLAIVAAIAILVSGRDSFMVAGVRISVRSPTNALTLAWLAGLVSWLSRWRWRVAIRPRGSWKLRDLSRAAVLPVILAVVIVSPLAGQAWRLWRTGGYVTQQSGLRSGPSGVDIATLAIGPPFHGLAGSFVRDVDRRLDIDQMESVAYVGWVGIVLAAMAWRRRPTDSQVRQWRIVTAVFAVWALGPYLMVLGHNTGLLLPGAVLRVIPIVNNARIPGRALIVVAMSASVLAAFAIRDLRVRQRGLIATAVVVAAMAESLAAPLPLTPLLQPGIYATVAADPTNSVVLPLPFGIRDGFGERGLVEHDAIFQQTRHHHPLAGGMVARLPPAIATWYASHEPFATLLRLSTGEEERVQASCDTMQQGLETAGVGFVVMYADASTELRRFVSTLPIERIDQDDHRVLFRMGRCAGE